MGDPICQTWTISNNFGQKKLTQNIDVVFFFRVVKKKKKLLKEKKNVDIKREY